MQVPPISLAKAQKLDRWRIAIGPFFETRGIGVDLAARRMSPS
jgi:hypothetical protein